MATAAQEIALMKKDIETLSSEVKQINSKIDNLTMKLLDPDNGVVSRVNKNTSFRKSYDNNILEEFRALQRWKSSVTKALWGLYAAITGWIIKIIFW